MTINETVTIKRGPKPGKTVAVFAGVHGNELAGVQALQNLLPTLQIKAGTAYFVLANPPAIARRQRSILKNLNRCFFTGNDGKTWEDERARELMALLNKCDALLDLHGYNGQETDVFAITDSAGVELAGHLPISAILTGISEVATGGTDCYMTSQGKIGICLECGSNFEPEKYVPVAEQSVLTFLGQYGLVDAPKAIQSRPALYRVAEVVKRETADFEFDQTYVNFQKLEPAQQFARDSQRKFIAADNTYILFPRPKQKVGEESFILLSKIEKV
ncbi:MAG: succinylglutamate desuccinylase/aspartoacylase family protein [Candidatus Berkelbacteria bacterium]|nr:MAG: succinylglutamate desuccinylase/aspartoacylase family protein [Candidatus Berkelbacteria bacterium]QQG51595.1 MAG: succinylglutamate desuccinylase/aspartoacylase family protein [Candidatus Berkelbacteria bacterium]